MSIGKKMLSIIMAVTMAAVFSGCQGKMLQSVQASLQGRQNRLQIRLIRLRNL
ncbi:hypothetical protein RE628_04765 [Paenibacillus sp. D2_2]|uniref:hypothetical protein n=1 Tax=Paenibacillus sp. D2_2 TaxID=3073092 RepID=UPI002814AFB5|nr:hypothetical protein [Paenibacillus sp. D2_2]WMT41782.1 hypothetical protein RE628_04765 [Paenibacillus sp. D2_2]